MCMPKNNKPSSKESLKLRVLYFCSINRKTIPEDSCITSRDRGTKCVLLNLLLCNDSWLLLSIYLVLVSQMTRRKQ